MTRLRRLPNDRMETYINALREIVDKSVQLVVTALPQMKQDRYSAVKKCCYMEHPVGTPPLRSSALTSQEDMPRVLAQRQDGRPSTSPCSWWSLALAFLR